MPISDSAATELAQLLGSGTAIIRLVGALLLEQQELWQLEGRPGACTGRLISVEIHNT
jgi:hypothetical protein